MPHRAVRFKPPGRRNFRHGRTGQEPGLRRRPGCQAPGADRFDDTARPRIAALEGSFAGGAFGIGPAADTDGGGIGLRPDAEE